MRSAISYTVVFKPQMPAEAMPGFTLDSWLTCEVAVPEVRCNHEEVVEKSIEQLFKRSAAIFTTAHQCFGGMSMFGLQ